MLNVERLRALHALSVHGSVQAAADALHVTTSAVSQQLAKLEDEVGQRLLERHGRGVRLTDAAGVLVEHTAGVLAAIERAAADIDASQNIVMGRIAVGAFATAARGLAPAALARLAAHHPRLRVSLAEQELDESVMRLQRGDLDVVIAQDWFNAPMALPAGLSRAPVLDDVADVALPSGHRLARRRIVPLKELAGESWVTWRPRESCHDWLLHTLRAQGAEPRIVHTAGEHATQLALVAAGLCASVIPRLGRDPVPPGVRIVQVKPALTRHVYALWRTDASKRPGIRATVEAFQASAKGRARRR
ncbi:MAG: LysR family transcriptional regulator [Acidobacteria bacterium]|nr:LysR family transcriptional regulator [Acidobacteriota bacterium]